MYCLHVFQFVSFFLVSTEVYIQKKRETANLYPSAGSGLPLCWIQAKTAHALDCISAPRCNIQTKGRTFCLFPQHSSNCPDSHLRKSTKRFLIIKTPQRAVQIYYKFPLIMLFTYQIYIYKSFIYYWYILYTILYISQSLMLHLFERTKEVNY